ncbi:hypothetical protein B0T26DRAFT_706775 [Lasiosphaeria miniovina]|uniref:BTB domain-containing protein n=1 Tax=Lasiosphaeria miniovina TaxID=1954250 RepID=A0AA40AWZ9_9PEZI|nr:uncharacterized protein B0T26DRAFT_706775 [Lasiosphaeria miniovina]KAK0723550.1 hypothetical protein B0T26DRAFT_706775 [Lasiosphaeria miniovina]
MEEAVEETHAGAIRSDGEGTIRGNGDLILVIGPEQVRLMVCSQVLRCASKVFDVMFGPHWSEGCDLSSTSPKEIPLEEDNASAMRTICCVLHHRNDMVSDEPTPDEILKIAIEVDKYDLAVALKFQLAQWLQPPKTNPNQPQLEMTDLGRLMAAAFILRKKDEFASYTLDLVMNYTGSYLDLLDEDTMNESIPFKIVYLLEERRNQMRADLWKLLLDGVKLGCTQPSRCAWRGSPVDSCRELLDMFGPSKQFKNSISSMAEKIGGIHKVESYQCGYKHHAEFKGYREDVEMAKTWATICTDCVQSGNYPTKCTFKHK